MEQFLSSVGITEPKEIIYNPSYEQLFEDEMQPGLEGYARGYLTELGAVNVLTGEYTGRSPKDKFIVMDDTCLLYTSPSPRDATLSRMPSSA